MLDQFVTTLSHVRLRRLFIEDPNVEAPCWFSRRSTDPFHVHAQILRFLVLIILAPIYIITPRTVYDRIYAHASWVLSLSSTIKVVLTTAPGGGAGAYAPTGSNPRWLLRVQIVNGAMVRRQQVCWSEEVRNQGYTALSYPMDSACILFREAGLAVAAASPTENRRFMLSDRKCIAERLLIEYCAATHEALGDRTEYVWLDEFCLSDGNQSDDNPERAQELGRLADIFRNAVQVAVFCHDKDCDHTSTACIWGTRLSTIGEILHAAAVIRLTRQQEQDGSLRTYAYWETARAFREQMQAKAAHDNRWHLYAIMQHSINAGAVSWQNAIHALVVEAITRDLAGKGFEDHKFLGKALNGLLPRRARLEDLKGEDGWTDLAWLLELNQGFYNAASLAAVCSLGEGDWLGRPIEPNPGNERLEPIVHAFPVGSEREGINTPLCIIGSKTMMLQNSLKRDPFGLYNNTDLRALKQLSGIFLAVIKIATLVTTVAMNYSAWIMGMIWAGSSLFVIFEMVVGTIYLRRDGWIFLDKNDWGIEPQVNLGAQDPDFAKLFEWGHNQLIPIWSPPKKQDERWNGSLLDLKNRVFVKVFVTNKPDASISLAIHGSGVTSILVGQKVDPDSVILEKVGMCNLPAYALAEMIHSGTLCVGAPLENEGRRDFDMPDLRGLISGILDLFYDITGTILGGRSGYYY
ncbi:hypothetical protein IW262DRAFT_1407651 [Armillaria fumosa]|nr:hypothetical protein IW262DRAFT_1407651 [Armillaria fumosa]